MADEKQELVDGGDGSVGTRDVTSGNSCRVEEINTDSDRFPDQMAVDEGPMSKDEKVDGQTTTDNGDPARTEWLDVLGSGQLRKKILRPGQGEHTKPERGMAITIRLKAWLVDGKEVESLNKFTFTQGEGEIVQAVDLCVCLMELGETAEIHSNSRFAYSEFGKEPDIPPDADMVFEVELLEVNPPPLSSSMTVDECCQMVDKKREYGNELFGRRDYSGAINTYTRALKFLEEAPGEVADGMEDRVNELLIKCYNNLAAAQLKVEAFSAALKSCNSALELDANNLKALFRKGKVLACQKEFSEAVNFLKKALAIEPSNKTIHQELSKLTASHQEELMSERAMYRRMVSDMAEVSDVSAKPGKKSVTMILIGLSALVAVVAVVAVVVVPQLT